MNLRDQRLIEEAADELGRLDATCALSPGAVELALRLVATAGLTEPTLDGFLALVAAEAEPLHDAALTPAALAWRDLLVTEERRMRGGALLSLARFDAARTASALIVPGTADFESTDGDTSPTEHRERLEAIWREPGSGRAVLERALDSAAWSPDEATGEASAALLLCAGGRTDRVRILPFFGVDPATRASAILAHRAGETSAWTELALRALATRARGARVAVRTVIDAPSSEEERLRALGRAAITARATLALIRRRLATTIPDLADELALSRPAANDSVERLLALGLAREVTGRGRDRVFAYEAACTMAASLLAAS